MTFKLLCESNHTPIDLIRTSLPLIIESLRDDNNGGGGGNDECKVGIAQIIRNGFDTFRNSASVVVAFDVNVKVPIGETSQRKVEIK